MRCKTFALILVLCILLCAMPPAPVAAQSDVCFIAVNDNLLELNSVPYFYGGVTYLPYWVFSDYGFELYFSYLSDVSIAILYNSDKQLFFELSSGNTYDQDNNTYQSKAVMRNGSVYFPAKLVCSFFGNMTCTFIGGNDYGDIVRLRDSRAVLTDAQFVRAASTLMQQRYEATKASSHLPTHTESIPQESEAMIPRDGLAGYLSFIGLPSDTVLSSLERFGASACFFLHADDIRSSPDTVRRLACEGHSLGVLCTDGSISEYEETAALLYETAHVRTLLVTSLGAEEATRQMAEESSLVFWSFDVDCISTPSVLVSYSKIISLLASRERDSSLFFSCDSVTDSFIRPLLQFMSGSAYELCAPREINIWAAS